MGCDSHGNLTDAEFSKPLPSIGIYVATASLICGAAMFADLLHAFRHRKYWFPCKYFSLNATTLTFISVCVKLSLDLNTPMPSRQDQLAKLSSSVFFCVVMANSMPSLGFMVTRDLLTNLVALGIIAVTDVVNICIQLGTGAIYVFTREHALVIVLMLLTFMILSFSAITIPATKRYLELKYKKKYEFALKECPSHAERRKGVPKLREDLMKFWMMAHTSSPQFVMARSVTCTASGFLCFLSAVALAEAIVRSVDRTNNVSKVWKAKDNTSSETCSVSETEEAEKNITMGLKESDKAPRAETSFTKNMLGLLNTEQKPTQRHDITTTATINQEIKTGQKDRTSGPAPYNLKQPIALKNRFHVLESNKEVSP